MLKTNIKTLLHICSHTHITLYDCCYWTLWIGSLRLQLCCNDRRRETSAHFHQATWSHTSAFILTFSSCPVSSPPPKGVGRNRKRGNSFPLSFHPPTAKHLIVRIFTTSSLWSSVRTHASQSVLANRNLQKIQNLLRDPLLVQNKQM